MIEPCLVAFLKNWTSPQPDINLEVGLGTQAEQISAVMVNYEKILLKDKSDFCLVVGDVTSTTVCAIVAGKVGVPVSQSKAVSVLDQSMPEEINRVLKDFITDWFFTTGETANDNLRRCNVTDE